MKIVFAGHLDRAFLLGGQPGRFRETVSETSTIHGAKDDPYRSFYHRAGMLALLSSATLAIPEFPEGAHVPLIRRKTDGRVFESIGPAELETDARRLAGILIRINAFSDEALATMNVRAHADPQPANPEHHLQDLMLSVLYAWMCRGTLTISTGDRLILAEVITAILDQGFALPFGLPDLRTVPLADPRSNGEIANLKLGDHADLNELRDASAVRLYRGRLACLSDSPRANHGVAMAGALREARAADPRFAAAPADIRLTTCRVRVVDNSDHDCIARDPFDWSDRSEAKSRQHVIVLSNIRSLY